MSDRDNQVSVSMKRSQLPIEQGSLLQFPEDPIACMKRLHARFGDLAALEDNGQRLVFVFSADLNRQVLADSETFHSEFFAVRGGRRSAQRRVTAGLLSQNGTAHRDARRVMMAVFAKKMLPKYHDTITQLTTEMTNNWSFGETRDLNEDMVRFMLRMTSALLFDIDDVDYSMELGSKIDCWVRMNHEVGMGALVSSHQFTDGYDRLLHMAEDLEVSVREMFVRHRSGPSDRVDILSLLFKSQESGSGMPEDELVGHANLLFGAAHLTTAHTLTWTLFVLAQHPDVLVRLREELDHGISGEIPTREEVESLTWLDHVIRESMRVLPASSYSQRICAQPAELGPLKLSRLTPVIFTQYITHHRPDLYDRPDEFLPERWESISPSSYEYFPFGAGPRRCIGAPLAMIELRTALAVILQRFHFQIVPASVVDGRVISTMLGPTTHVPAVLLPTSQLPESAPVTGTIHDLMQLPTAARPIQRRTAA